uniref:C-type lectin domain-containing protein n=1 Tax=Caenorhabditis tropicalis TaxID=1561998 RepID=A0A1I7TF33_9PELO
MAYAYDTSSCESEEDGAHHHGGGRGENRGCPANWIRLDRGTYGWCVRVFTGSYSQAESENRCRTQGATLSGLQNQQEAFTITKAALPLISRPSGSIRIGLTRTPTCLKSRLSHVCTTMNSFYWTDGATTGTNGLLWNNNQPDNSLGVTQNCAVLLAAHTPTVVDAYRWEADRIDDVTCNYENPERPDHVMRGIRGFVCGKRATF